MSGGFINGRANSTRAHLDTVPGRDGALAPSAPRSAAQRARTVHWAWIVPPAAARAGTAQARHPYLVEEQCPGAHTQRHHSSIHFLRTEPFGSEAKRLGET
jgi:hypothetical protein